jgi:hypothetical protein
MDHGSWLWSVWWSESRCLCRSFGKNDRQSSTVQRVLLQEVSWQACGTEDLCMMDHGNWSSSVCHCAQWRSLSIHWDISVKMADSLLQFWGSYYNEKVGRQGILRRYAEFSTSVGYGWHGILDNCDICLSIGVLRWISPTSFHTSLANYYNGKVKITLCINCHVRMWIVHAHYRM